MRGGEMWRCGETYWTTRGMCRRQAVRRTGLRGNETYTTRGREMYTTNIHILFTNNISDTLLREQYTNRLDAYAR